MKTDNVRSKIIASQRFEIAIYGGSLAVMVGFMAYIMAFRGIILPFQVMVALYGAAMMLLLKLVSQVNRYKVLSMSPVDLPMKELSDKLHKIRSIDFITTLLFFYGIAIAVVLYYIQDIGGMSNFKLDNSLAWQISVLVILLIFVPWFLKGAVERRDKKIISMLR